jgi:hypothetical protein
VPSGCNGHVWVNAIPHNQKQREPLNNTPTMKRFNKFQLARCEVPRGGRRAWTEHERREQQSGLKLPTDASGSGRSIPPKRVRSEAKSPCGQWTSRYGGTRALMCVEAEVARPASWLYLRIISLSFHAKWSIVGTPKWRSSSFRAILAGVANCDDPHQHVPFKRLVQLVGQLTPGFAIVPRSPSRSRPEATATGSPMVRFDRLQSANSRLYLLSWLCWRPVMIFIARDRTAASRFRSIEHSI